MHTPRIVDVSHIDPSLERQIAARPDRPVDAIVSISQPWEQVADSLPAGVEVRTRYRLIQALAVTAQPDSLLELADQPWVKSIEPDRMVHAQEERGRQPPV
jgi:hypothetical protein